ncbi:hypothetical protein JAB9_51010 [Janthinobacterium sp. HH107]|uniref:hypothetical protein n=1 Tax=Janthinobacterium sp. HH107 TaxID=1537279 RepID=UPI000873CE24|nr:hypothetical protein [Janthinobacterium sp. HH107]OEZ91118.1 hypothetical protein JAB9_51010 [Janthinobacterium sp. HH107]
MSNFPNKQFEGVLYTFGHLQPVQMKVPLNALGSLVIDMHVAFGCHCFTEAFDNVVHRPDHRYTYQNELRAFDRLRYECSLQLPRLMQAMLQGTIYNADESYTYAAHITLESIEGPQSYSIFFNLKKDKQASTPAVRMFVKSAYLKPLVAKPNAQNWRFVSLAGQIAEAFPPREKKPKPTKKKKKAPQGLVSAS